VEIEIGQREEGDEVLAGEAHLALGKFDGDRAGLGALNLLRRYALHEGDGSSQGAPEDRERWSPCREKLGGSMPGERAARALGGVADDLDLAGERKHVGREAGFEQIGKRDLAFLRRA